MSQDKEAVFMLYRKKLRKKLRFLRLLMIFDMINEKRQGQYCKGKAVLRILFMGNMRIKQHNKIIRGWVAKTALFLGILFLVCACGRKEYEGDDTEGIAGNEPVTLDWYINFTWYASPWGGNAVSEKITGDTGISINFITPKGSEEEKFNALMSSDSLPDIITLGWWENQVDEMISKDMVYALNELADKYDACFWEAANPEIVSWYTREDGNLYCYPNSSYTPSDYEKYGNIASNQTFLVRKDIYEALGCPDMTTPEGFTNAVKAAAQLYPEVDGYPLIPIGAHVFDSTGCVSFDQYLQNFLAIPYEKNGKYYDRYTDPEYIRWLKTFRKLGQEGYLKEDIFIDQRTQMEEKLARGQYFCMIYQRTDLSDQQIELYNKNPDMIYMAVDGPKNAVGDDHILPGGGINGWTVTFISKNCRYPDRAIKLFSYLISDEGQMATYLGVEGVTYDMVEGKPVVREEVRKLMNSDREAYNKKYGADNTYWMFQNNARQLEWRHDYEPPNGQLEEWTFPYSHYMAQYEISFDRNSEAGSADVNIKKLWSKTLPQLLLASTEEEFDRIFDEFVKEREKLGFELVVEESTRQMEYNKEKLGLS